jgi:FKBP-type peptidyl-prolyl cis-trans isomerase
MNRYLPLALGGLCLIPLGCSNKPRQVLKVPDPPRNRVIMVQPPDNSKGQYAQVGKAKEPKPAADASSVESPKPPAVPAQDVPQSSSTDSAAPPKVGKMTKTPSGLQYEDLKVGTGPSPKNGQTVRVKYTGWLMSGKKFDSSSDHPETKDGITFPLGQHSVIDGWDEGIASMKVGGKRILVIPPGLAYGPQGYPPDIPPNATLKFEVELMEVQ